MNVDYVTRREAIKEARKRGYQYIAKDYTDVYYGYMEKPTYQHATNILRWYAPVGGFCLIGQGFDDLPAEESLYKLK